MKRIMSVMLSVLLLAGMLVLPVSVSAAGSPWETAGTKFNVFENWDTVADSADKAVNSACNLYIKDGKIILDKNSTAWHSRAFALSATVDANAAEGMGFYVENNTSTAQSVIPRIYIGDNWATMKPNATVYRYDSATQTVTATTTTANRPIGIPAGFKGFIAFPYESVHWDRTDTSNQIGKTLAALKSANELKFTSLGFVVGGVNLAESSGEQMIMDNFFYYGKNVTEKNNGVIPLAVKSNDEIIEDNIQIIARDMEAFTKVNPQVTYHSQYDAGTVKALTYEGASIGGKPTKVFAYIGYPANMEANKKYPAVVLVHGGGGHAFPDWVRKWTAQGYIAIAMDNTGFFPTSANNNPYNATNWVWGLSNSPFAQDGYGNVPQCDSYNTLMQTPDKQWMYHAVAQTILAKGVLEADSKVDASKIGLVGISWGSKVAACAIGYEKFAFAVCQYVAGHLEEAQNHNAQYSKLNGYKQWKADRLFDKVDYPVLFQQWTYDSSASIKSTSKCYEDLMPEGAVMSLRTSWSHGHDWNVPLETYRFADSIVKNGNKLTEFTSQPDGSYYVDCNINVPSDATSVKAKVQYVTSALRYTNNGGSWKPVQTFNTAELTVKDGRVYGEVPAEAAEYYVEITTVAGGKTYYTASLYKKADASLNPSQSATAQPTQNVTAKPTPTVTSKPTATVTSKPTQSATAAPVESASAAPVESATAAPVESATAEPVESATAAPVESATATPVESATATPVESATATGEAVPTEEASQQPTETAEPVGNNDNTIIIVIAVIAVAAAISAVVAALVVIKKKQ